MKNCILFLLAFVLLSCNARKGDCSRFRTGTFKYADYDGQDTIIIRNDSIQVEQNNLNGDKYIGSIKWLSKCKYILTYIDVNNPEHSSLIGTKFNVDITSVTQNGYSYIAYDDTRRIEGEMVRIE